MVGACPIRNKQTLKKSILSEQGICFCKGPPSRSLALFVMVSNTWTTSLQY